MDVLTSETCWALNSEIKKQVTSSWSIVIQLERKFGTKRCVDIYHNSYWPHLSDLAYLPRVEVYLNYHIWDVTHLPSTAFHWSPHSKFGSITNLSTYFRLTCLRCVTLTDIRTFAALLQKCSVSSFHLTSIRLLYIQKKVKAQLGFTL